MHTKILAMLLAFFAAIAAFPTHAITVLTTFETPEVPGAPNPGGNQYVTQSTNSTAFSNWMASGGNPGWTSNGAVVFGEVGSGSSGNAGQQYIFLTNGRSATYTYTGLQVGTSYALSFSFDYSGTAPGGSYAGRFSAVDGSNFVIPATALAHDTFSGAAVNTYFNNLGLGTNQSLTFTAQTNNLAFTFIATSPVIGNHWLAIDNVSVGIEAVPVPEPKTYLLMFAGLSAVAFLVRRRKPSRA